MLRAGVALAVLAAVLPAALPAAAASVPGTQGADVSFPQCGAPLPASVAVAIVGVNDGLATGTNPCLGQQLDWARAATAGETAVDAVQLYVNTGNPGHAAVWWPTSDTARDGTPVPGTHGECTGGEDAACAFVYGWSLARDDLARAAGVSAARWWLDVETVNSWSADRPANLASVEGMTQAFQASGALVGLYSTKRQFAAVVGAVAPGSTLARLPSWLAGAVTVQGAKERCLAGGLTPGGAVLLAQYVSGGLDGDVRCGVPALGTAAPIVVPASPRWLRAG